MSENSLDLKDKSDEIEHVETPAASESYDKLSVRWMALGAVVILLTLLGSEKLVWNLVSSDTRQFLNHSLALVATSNITPEQKENIRRETVERLAVFPVMALGVTVLFMAVVAGFISKMHSTSVWSGFIAGISGAIVAFIVSGAMSGGAFIAVLIFGFLALAGSFLSNKIMPVK